MVENSQMRGPDFLKRLGQTLVGNETKPDIEQDTQDYDKKTKNLEKQYEYMETKERLTNPPSLRELQEKRQQEIDEERRAAEARAKDLEDERMQRIEDDRKAAEAAAVEEKQKREEKEAELQQERMTAVTTQLQRVNDELAKIRESGGTNNQFAQMSSYIKDLKDSISELGLVNPGAARDAGTELELAKLQYLQAKEDREFKWKMRQDDKNWELEKMKLSREWDLKLEELRQQQNKDKMFANMPRYLGDAIAKGLVDGASAGEGQVEEQPQPQNRERIRRQPQPQITAEEGEAGEIDCPNCKSPISINEDADKVVCVRCSSVFPINRVPASQPADIEDYDYGPEVSTEIAEEEQ